MLKNRCDYGNSIKKRLIFLWKFLKNTLADLQNKAFIIEENAPKKRETQDGYITILGAKNIENKIRLMLKETQERIYVMASCEILRKFSDELLMLCNSGKKVVILSDDFELENAIYHKTQTEKNQIRLITDSRFVLTGILSGNVHDTCLYSGQQNLVDVMKEALKNKIELLGK